ncbi:MAG TPA: MBL fold metallo-hydrolase [Armatimonadota bacterium]|nr:MBL fold metallo-hydrolase [Armatimonadota bacterium]
MDELYDISNVKSDFPKHGGVIVYWLGGAGFVFKFAAGETICIDPYLSDVVERLFGFRRLSLPPVSAENLHFDCLLITHDHADHLDIDSFDGLMEANPRCRVIAPDCCADFLKSKQKPFDLASVGAEFSVGSVDIQVAPADHGDLCPSAVGYFLTFNGHRLYFTGDTAFSGSIVLRAVEFAPEIVIPCINGAFGNMDSEDAANLVFQCRAKTAIPSHFWLFAEHGGSPAEFQARAAAKSPETEVMLLTPGRGCEI